MSNSRITVNGQHYDSVEAMPPDVRRTYDEAMRTLAASQANAQNGGTTQVFTGKAGDLGASVVVNRTVVVNNRTYGSLDELPPEARKQLEDALHGAGQTPHPKTTLNFSLNLEGPQVRTLADARKAPTIAPGPIESSSLESRIRDLPVSLAILVLIALALWALLGRQ
jgi:hypothetical protein